jgi:hypothetical protein
MVTLFNKSASKGFFFVSLGVVGYFCFLWLNAYVIHLDFYKDVSILGFFGEILTLPLLLFQLVLLVLSIIYCIKDKFRLKTYSFLSFLILLVSNVYFLGNLLVSKIE